MAAVTICSDFGAPKNKVYSQRERHMEETGEVPNAEHPCPPPVEPGKMTLQA